MDDEGRSPFHYAFDGKYYKVITLLGKYCGYSIDEDGKPKYKISLGKQRYIVTYNICLRFFFIEGVPKFYY